MLPLIARVCTSTYISTSALLPPLLCQSQSQSWKLTFVRKKPNSAFGVRAVRILQHHIFLRGLGGLPIDTRRLQHQRQPACIQFGTTRGRHPSSPREKLLALFSFFFLVTDAPFSRIPHQPCCTPRTQAAAVPNTDTQTHVPYTHRVLLLWPENNTRTYDVYAYIRGTIAVCLGMPGTRWCPSTSDSFCYSLFCYFAPE